MSVGTRLRAAIKGEVSAADVDALLRGSGHLEELREAIAQRREAGELTHPGRPWETHAEISHALLYFWVAQALATIARALKEVDDETDPATVGYMPPATHTQAMSLLRQVPDFLALTAAAVADPTYEGDRALPVSLQPRIEVEGRCPPPHLKGLLRGAQRLNEYAQVEVETYCGTLSHPDVPEQVASAMRRLQAELARAQSNLRTAEAAVMPILNGQRVDQQTHEEAENYLWSSLETYMWLGQIVAMPSLLDEPVVGRTTGTGGHRPPPPRVSRTVAHGDRWLLTSDMARRELSSTGRTPWAEDELQELWTKKRWRLSPEEARYLDEVSNLAADGSITSQQYLAECPFNPIWTPQRDVVVAGRRFRRGQQFAYNHHDGKGEVLTGFHAVGDFMACEDDD